ncbi:MAG: Uma2 family endonuclease [Candidatus Tectomicrobia bacterium]|nr:Uma2 family endonuclease [Candidatus Tectomicrobia bacterium]
MSQTRTAYRWTTADVERLPDDPLLRYEIIDGELIVSRRPHLHHARILTNLVVRLHEAVRAGNGEILPEPGLVLGLEGEDNVIPDIAILLPDRLHLATGPTLSGTPNIAVEIVSESSRTIDYVQKRYFYERTGAQEYWIIDRFEHQIHAWDFTGDRTTSVSYGDADTFTTPLLPTLALPVRDLWP